jgi:hypothetical protein
MADDESPPFPFPEELEGGSEIAHLMHLLHLFDPERFPGGDDSSDFLGSDDSFSGGSGDSDDSQSSDGPRLRSSIPARAAAASLPGEGEDEEPAEEAFQRMLRESEREERERQAIREFLRDRRRLHSLLAAMPGVDPKDPCFLEFCE